MSEACTAAGCFYNSPIELRPTPFKRDHPTTKVSRKKNAAKKSSVATKVEKPTSPQPMNGPDKGKIISLLTITPAATSPEPTENASSPNRIVGANINVVASASEASDPVLEKAKTTVASKMEDPASVEFEDMTRAIRKDSFGQSIDTICGHVRGKRKSGTETGERAFLYLVKEDIALVDYGFSGSVAGNAYRTVCSSRGIEAR